MEFLLLLLFYSLCCKLSYFQLQLHNLSQGRLRASSSVGLFYAVMSVNCKKWGGSIGWALSLIPWWQLSANPGGFISWTSTLNCKLFKGCSELQSMQHFPAFMWCNRLAAESEICCFTHENLFFPVYCYADKRKFKTILLTGTLGSPHFIST